MGEACSIVGGAPLDHLDFTAPWRPDSKMRSSRAEGLGTHCKPSDWVSQAISLERELDDADAGVAIVVAILRPLSAKRLVHTGSVLD
jgi:hypothetical protein